MKKIWIVLLGLLLLVACSKTPEATSPVVSPTADVTATGEATTPPNPAAPTDEPTPSPTNSTGFTFNEENFPRIDGSTATIPLAEAVKAVLLQKDRTECTPEFNGTNSAWTNLINDSVDLLIVYEMPDDAKQTLENEKGVELEMAAIGRDALVFLVNKQNKTDGIKTSELQQIYTGDITNWNEVGGENKKIKAFQRNATSGSQTLMNKLVMKGREMADAPVEYVIEGMEGLVESIAAYDNAGDAIGYNVYYYVSQMKNDVNIKLLSIDGVAPSSESIGNGSYPFTNDFYVAIRKDEPAGSPTRILYEWLQGDQARTLMVNEGYVPVAK